MKKSIFWEGFYENRLLYNNIYVCLHAREKITVVNKILELHKNIKCDKHNIICGIDGGYFDVKLNHQFEVMFLAEDIDKYEYCDSIVRAVFAFGNKVLLSEVPSTWGVNALMEFPNGIPDIFLRYEESATFVLSSKELYMKINACFDEGI
jgi:hypothetical protein